MLRPDWIVPYKQKTDLYLGLNRNIQEARNIVKEANQIITSTTERRELTEKMIQVEVYDGNYEEALKLLKSEKIDCLSSSILF